MSYDAEVTRPPAPALVTVHLHPRAREAVENAMGLSLPSSSRVANGPGNSIAFRIGPQEWLLHASPEEEDTLVDRLESAVDGEFASVVVVTDAHARFRVSGPDAREVLCQAVAIDLDPRGFEPGRACRCAFGKTSALVHCVSDEPAYDIYVESTLTEYARCLLDVATGDKLAT